MVQLRSCYFCGTTGALSEYEALPPELGVVSEASPRVILCDRCQTKLTNVLAPLVDSVDRGEAAVGVRPDVAAGHSSSTDPTPTGGADPVEEVGSNAPDAPDADEQPSQPEVTFARTETPAAEDTDEAADSDSDTDSAASVDGAGDSTGGDSETDATGEDGAETREDGDDTSEDEDDTREDGEDTTGEDEPPDASDAESVAVDETPTESAEETDAARSAADLDRVYHKLLRFLRNREFPIPRTEVEAIAQSAYDLTATEASQVIQRTIDRDVLEERDGELHRR